MHIHARTTTLDPQQLLASPGTTHVSAPNTLHTSHPTHLTTSPSKHDRRQQAASNNKDMLKQRLYMQLPVPNRDPSDPTPQLLTFARASCSACINHGNIFETSYLKKIRHCTITNAVCAKQQVTCTDVNIFRDSKTPHKQRESGTSQQDKINIP